MSNRRLEHVLCIEDDADIRALLQISLEEIGGFTVTMYGSGQQALASAELFSADLILLDFLMPFMDGPDTLRTLRALPNVADMPVVFMTAMVKPHDIAQYTSMSCIGMIQKPFDVITLPDTVRDIWQRHRADLDIE